MAKKKEVVITCNATNVKAVIEGLERGMAALAREEEHLLGVIKQRGYAENDEKKRIKELEKAMDAMRTNIQKNREETKKYEQVMKDLSGATLKDLKKALQEGKNALNKMSERDPKRKQLVDDLKRIQNQIDKNTGAIKAQGNAFATTAKNLATYMIGFAGFNKIKSLVEDVFKSNLKLSDSLANIRKVSGLSTEAINDLYRNIAKIDSRNTIETLNQLAYTGAKLGIGQNYGVEGLTGFVKAAEQVQMALGEDMGEKALPELSKMVEVMGLIPKYGVEQSMQKAASAIFQLGATSTATGTNIVEFSKRLMGLANVSRVSTEDLLALGSASDAMGLMPEVSATAFNKLFTSLQKNHNLIEKSLDIPEGTIRKLYDAGKTMDAMVLIFDKMNQKGNLNLLGTVFKDLGSDGARLVNVMATMSDRVDILKKHLEVSRDAFKEGEAVIGEYMIQNQTAAAMVERAANLWAKAFVNPEGVDMVKEMAQAWYDLSKSMTQSEALMSSLRTSIEWIATAIGALIKLFPALIRFAMIFGSAFGFKAALTGISGLSAGFKALYKDIALANGAMGTFNVVMKSNAFLFAASSLITVISLLIDYSKTAEEATKREVERQAQLKKAFEESKEAVERSIKPLSVYKAALDDANLSEREKMEMVKQFKGEYQDYLDYLGIEINSAYDLAQAYGQVVQAMKLKKAYEERESYRTQVNGENRMERIGAQAKVEGAARALKIEGVDKSFLEKNQKLSTSQLYSMIMKRKYGENITVTKSGNVYRTSADRRKAYTEENLGSNELWDALISYQTNYRAERNTNREVDAMFNSEYAGLSNFDIDEFNRKIQEARWKRKGSLERTAPDKAGAAAARKAEAERRKQARAEMKEEQQQAKAIIDNVKNYYQRQINAIVDMANETGMSSDLQKQMVDGMQQRMNEALANVRKAIGGTENDWEAFKKTMRDDLYEPLNENGENFSTELLDKIMDNNLVQLRKMIENLSKELNQQGSVLLDQILRKATENEGKNSKMANQLMRAREKELLEKNYTGKVDMETENTMEQFGIAGLTDNQMRDIRSWSQGGQEKTMEKFFEMRSNYWQAAFAAARNNIAALYQADINSKKGQEEVLALLFGPDWKEALTGSELQGILNMSADMWEVFYMKLIEHTDKWTDAQKKAYDEVKKRQDYIFENRPDILTIDNAAMGLETAEREQNRFGEPATFGRQMGLFDTIQNDPELMRLDILQARAELYYNRMQELRQKDLISEEQLKDAKDQMTQAQIAMQDKLVESIQSRTQALTNAVQPITDFAEQAGQKLGDMMFNMESQSMTWNQIWKNMLLAMGKSIIQMGQQYAIQALQRSLFNKQIEADETLHQSLLTAIALGGAIARMEGEFAIDQGRLIQKKVVDGQEISEEITLATILTSLGISEGASKTIGTLGWWGIPLIAVISALLMGLLTSALSTAGAESTSASSTKGANRKLVSGMLTYDKGNVQRFIGQDGKVYTATEEAQPKDGLVTHPIATTVQGQPALVAENGPEIVIGRETTKAIMMNEPQLIKYLADYGKTGGFAGGWRPFDSGNVESVANDSQNTASNESTEMQRTLNALTQTVALLQQQLAKGIKSSVNMYGTDGLYENMQKANKFMSKYQ